ncbi:MaoC family dehydratase N-terminal domain-containing protein [Mycobacterium sp. MYCO198283]|uniref:FAS1-like dehydratase domain-containing protein n=1 Tax=Mycobacterium sp. MYCO198283 TaxID=2883505 RepID=UPI001E2AD557|nr:MaoC family dehydratase N-terminal domain-containing protein [Mycobacterium sp. MYCO198283]MCG5432320.1 MaoC family dehydratase N-terminal domain-containing protein [Mycobacterium sp. MYCO198283]
MALAEEIIGTHYRHPDYFAVGREKVREYSAAVQADHPAHHDEAAAAELGYDGLVAPLTFIAVAGRRVQLAMFEKFDVGINIARVIHRDQKLLFHRPVKVGDKLFFDTYLDSVLQSHGTVITQLRSEVTDADGEPVMTTVVTMIGEAESDEASAEQVAAIRARLLGQATPGA